MYQKIEFDALITGERYFIRYGAYKWISGKFNKFENNDYGVHALFSNLKKNIGSGWKYKGIKWRMYSHYIYYKYITNIEYKQKLRDKYDETVLKIVLKKIVNEDFEWN